jgi:hypothetical protein
MILIMKTNSLNQKYILKCSPHQYWNALEKPNNLFCKNISPIFKYLNFIFQIIKILKSNSNTCK